MKILTVNKVIQNENTPLDEIEYGEIIKVSDGNIIRYPKWCVDSDKYCEHNIEGFCDMSKTPFQNWLQRLESIRIHRQNKILQTIEGIYLYNITPMYQGMDETEFSINNYVRYAWMMPTEYVIKIV